MEKYFEALERLAMPDELHTSECEKLGIGLTEDFDLVEQALLELTSIKEANPSKALECLDRIDNTLCLNNIKGKLDFGIDTEEHSDCDSVISMTEDLEYIKQALTNVQEQELIKGGRVPNKEVLYLLQCLKEHNDEQIFYVNRTYGNKYIVPQKQFDDLTNENTELKKKARAFEIIKEKRIDIDSFYSSFIERDFNYDFYSSFYGSYGRNKLTKEEFNLMIEVL